MYLRQKSTVRQGWEKDVIRENRHQIYDPLAPRGAQSVRGVIGGRPRVGAVGHASVGELVQNALMGEGLRAEEDQVLETVREAVVGVVPSILAAVGLGGEDDVEGADRLVGLAHQAAERGGGRTEGRDSVGALVLRAEDREEGGGRHPPVGAAFRTREGAYVDDGCGSRIFHCCRHCRCALPTSPERETTVANQRNAHIRAGAIFKDIFRKTGVRHD